MSSQVTTNEQDCNDPLMVLRLNRRILEGVVRQGSLLASQAEPTPVSDSVGGEHLGEDANVATFRKAYIIAHIPKIDYFVACHEPALPPEPLIEPAVSVGLPGLLTNLRSVFPSCDGKSSNAVDDVPVRDIHAHSRACEQLRSLVALGVAKVMTKRGCQSACQAVSNHLDGVVRELQQVSTRVAKLEDVQGTYISEVNKMVLGNGILARRLSQQASAFRSSETKDVLDSRQPGEVIEIILAAYGHQNNSFELLKRRDPNFSRWTIDFVPDSVRHLVTIRFSQPSQSVNALVQKAWMELQDQVALERNECLRSLFSANASPNPDELLEVWRREPFLRMPGVIARIEASSQALKEARQDAEGATKFIEAIGALKVVVNELVKERIQTLKDLHKRQRFLIELESSDEFLRRPNGFLTVSPRSAAAIATKAATYGVEGDKNYFVACFRALSPNNNRASTFLRPFLNSEAEFLAQSLHTQRPTCLDDIVGIMPRLVLGAAALPSEEAHELLSRIFNTPGCPQWLISWHQYRHSRGLDRLPSVDARADTLDTWTIEELGREILAYGRYKGAELPLPPCLYLSGPPIRRGLMDEHLALLRLGSFDGTINQDLQELLNAERSVIAETPIVDHS